MTDNWDFSIPTLGKANRQSPANLSNEDDDFKANYVTDSTRILYTTEVPSGNGTLNYSVRNTLELAGPREKIYFDPAKVRAAVVTCGGLCPGLNDVIRAIVMTLWYRYGVKEIAGIRFGYQGLIAEYNTPPIRLTPDIVADIHRKAGTILGSSRGNGHRVLDIVDELERLKINILFTIGGDGTQRGALALHEECKRRGIDLAVVGIPKTIDNDLSFSSKSFGFESAVEAAVGSVASAHVEAHDAVNGVGIVKVMGRDSGFIAAHTALAINDVNFVLIPEVPFDLYGENGLLTHLMTRIKLRNHAVILVAEGSGQDLFPADNKADASGNKKLKDIGLFLKEKITDYFEEHNMELNLKYIDPSYIIRSTPANANDSIYCASLGNCAVHAAMAGKTGLLIGLLHDSFIHVPINMAVSRRNRINPDKSLWRNVTEATGQPLLMKNI